MKTKLTHKEWFAQINKQSPDKLSPVLGIRFDPRLVRGSKREECWIPFSTKGEWVGAGYVGELISFKDDPTVTSANRLETTLLQLVARTDYNSFPDKTKIECGRYIVNLSKANTIILVKLFDYVFKNKSKKTSKTWLEPLQLMILERQTRHVVKPKKKPKIKNPEWYEEEDIPTNQPYGVSKPAFKIQYVDSGRLKGKPWNGDIPIEPPLADSSTHTQILDMGEVEALYKGIDIETKGNIKSLPSEPQPEEEVLYSDKRALDLAKAGAMNLLGAGRINTNQLNEEVYRRYREIKLRERQRDTVRRLNTMKITITSTKFY